MLVALSLYCQLPFGKFDQRNPEVVRFAELIGRTPSALAMKLSNIASLDPAITSTGRSGLANASSTDRAMFEEMQSDWEVFAREADVAVASFGISLDPESQLIEPEDYTGVDRVAQVSVRVGQAFFRRSVMSAYDYRCCVSGLDIGVLLVASHIVPWRVDNTNRLNPRNGLCLSALHDRCFDTGVISVGADMTLLVSPTVTGVGGGFFASSVLAYQGKRITLPNKFQPDPGFLAYHRENIFRS